MCHAGRVEAFGSRFPFSCAVFVCQHPALIKWAVIWRKESLCWCKALAITMEIYRNCLFIFNMSEYLATGIKEEAEERGQARVQGAQASVPGDGEAGALHGARGASGAASASCSALCQPVWSPQEHSKGLGCSGAACCVSNGPRQNPVLVGYCSPSACRADSCKLAILHAWAPVSNGIQFQGR